ncbi:hypothetical protein [Streptomyces sp. NPDC057280]|uniref:hypothetical protein n=1 Tax=Streptomyces sp. NPDC057280 TaxID=3346081 RepID=UPI0036269939
MSGRVYGEFVDLARAAQPFHGALRSQAGGGLRAAGVGGERRRRRPRRGEADGLRFGEGERGGEAGAPDVADQPAEELDRLLFVLVRWTLWSGTPSA